MVKYDGVDGSGGGGGGRSKSRSKNRQRPEKSARPAVRRNLASDPPSVHGYEELSRYHFRIDYRQGKANRAAEARTSTSSSPLCTKFLSAELTSSFCYFSSGDPLRKKTSKPRNQGGDS